MSRRAVNRFLVVYLVVIWTAVLLRIDQFPLTWASMYSVFSPKPHTMVRTVDKEQLKRGFFVTQRDGTTGWIGVRELNIPKWNMFRLYYQRAFGSGPNTHTQGNANLDRLSRWVRGLQEGEPNFAAEWDWRLFWSLNKTLGREPSDPDFIVRIQASFEQAQYAVPEVRLTRRRTNQADLNWKEEWRERWK